MRLAVAGMAILLMGSCGGNRRQLQQLSDGGPPYDGGPTYAFDFAGDLRVEDVRRYGTTDRYAGRQATPPNTYRDGVFSLTFEPAPYGLRVCVRCFRPERLLAKADEWSVFDFGGTAHDVEFRGWRRQAPPAAYPSPTITIGPDSSTIVEIDVVTPAARLAGISPSEFPRLERLPVISQGFALAPSDEAKAWQRLENNIGRGFKIHMRFTGVQEAFEYRITLVPGTIRMRWKDR